jgi:hypothetical protein
MPRQAQNDRVGKRICGMLRPCQAGILIGDILKERIIRAHEPCQQVLTNIENRIAVQDFEDKYFYSSE